MHRINPTATEAHSRGFALEVSDAARFSQRREALAINHLGDWLTAKALKQKEEGATV